MSMVLILTEEVTDPRSAPYDYTPSYTFAVRFCLPLKCSISRFSIFVPKSTSDKGTEMGFTEIGGEVSIMIDGCC